MGGGIIPHTFPQLMGALSVLLAFVNVSGGFVITKRMLDMFKRRLQWKHRMTYLTINRPN
jgi:NAD(P) transhydrogenase